MATAALVYEPEYDDESAVRAAQHGDRTAFSSLYEHHNSYVYNLVLRSTGNRDDAYDICQEVWLTVHKQLPALREPGAFGVWLRRIASRACIDFARRRHSRPEFAVEDFESLEVEGDQSPEDAAVTQERGLQAWEALGNLAPRQGIALFLREVEGRTYKEIALALGSSVDAVETLLFRARTSLSRNFDSIETSPEQRCQKAKQVMASVMDGEVGRLAQMTAQAHLNNCTHCQRDLANVKRGSMAYLGIPMAAVTAEQGLGLITATTGGTVGLGTLASIIASLKAWLIPLAAATAVATTAGVVVVPGIVQDHPSPTTTADVAPPPQGPIVTDSTFGAPASPSSPSIGSNGTSTNGPIDPSGSGRIDPKAPISGLLPGLTSPAAPGGSGPAGSLPLPSTSGLPGDLPVLVTTPELPALPAELPGVPDPQTLLDGLPVTPLVDNVESLLSNLPVAPLLDGVQDLLGDLPVAPLIDTVQTLVTDLPVVPIVENVQSLLPPLPAIELPALPPLLPQLPGIGQPGNSPIVQLPGLLPGGNPSLPQMPGGQPLLPQLPIGPAAGNPMLPSLPSLPILPQGGNPIPPTLPTTPLLPQGGGGLPQLPIPPLLPQGGGPLGLPPILPILR